MGRAAFAIIADDLTGACDTALQFRIAGYPALVGLRGAQVAPEPGAVLAVDTDSRDCAPHDAYARTRAAVEQQSGRALRLYKKVDSTLRGNVGAELEALLDTSGVPIVLLAPAFPASGRVVRDGCLYVRGQPLHQSSFAPSLPRPSSAVAELVGASTRQPITAALSVEDLRGAPAALERRLLGLAAAQRGVIVCDAEDERDLETLAGVLARHPDWPAAGSAGLAAALARQFRPATPTPATLPRASGPILTLAGSRNPATLAQLEALHSTQAVPVLAVAGRLLLSEAYVNEIERVSALLAAHLRAGHDVIVTPDPHEPDRSGEAGIAQTIAERLGAIVARAAGQLGGLVLTGGSTAAALLPHLGIGALSLAAQVEPGVPAMVAQDGLAGLPIITKAGGFGDRETLVRARAFLRREDVVC